MEKSYLRLLRNISIIFSKSSVCWGVKFINFSKDKLIHDYDLEYENNATFKKIASSLDLPKDTLIKETSKIIESSIEVDRCKKCKHLFECKNNVEG